MPERPQVTLERASADKAMLLSNLLGLYMHDMSEIFQVEPGADGLFRYEKLPLYWSQPATHFAFLIYVGGRIGGCALVTRGSPATDRPEDLDVAEFFVLRGHRRCGVGREAAFLLWDHLPGQWVVRVAAANTRALAFWHATIRQYTGGAFGERQRAGGLHTWHDLTFGSGGAVERA